MMDAANELDAMAEVKQEDVSIACGVAHYRPSEDKNIASVLARADALMYKNKRSSR
jgi:PleD family two-component response regulator